AVQPGAAQPRPGRGHGAGPPDAGAGRQLRHQPGPRQPAPPQVPRRLGALLRRSPLLTVLPSARPAQATLLSFNGPRDLATPLSLSTVRTRRGRTAAPPGAAVVLSNPSCPFLPRGPRMKSASLQGWCSEKWDD